jgi:hypothetical protein
MALKGDIKFTKTIDHPDGETEMITIYVPMDASEDDPNYEHRGTKVEIEQVKKIEVEDLETSYDDIYLVITSCGFTQYKVSNNVKIWYLSIIYHVFLTEEDRELNPNMPHKVSDWTNMDEIDITSSDFKDKDIITYAYDTLKKQHPFLTMKNV